VVQSTPVADARLLESGDEAGTAPGDRRFRPDVEGLRAVAVLLVVLYHAGIPGLTGGYVGVDVFFVISGFVITGLLLRERRSTSATSFIDFYARRSRRILPAATLVLVTTVVFSYVLLGVVGGNSAADDGRWAALFLSNFHFASVGTNYLTASRPPSPLQNYWSLSVEEQFYLVFPAVFVLVARLKGRFSLEARLCLLLGAIIAASYWLSIAQTASSPTSAYFSPFTRAWELALGALLAAGTPWLKRIPTHLGGAATWIGLLAIVLSAFAFSAQTSYPGSLVAIPVVGTALVIAGGLRIPRAGAERVLATGPMQWVGRRSYGLYLWHWPILILVAEHAGKSSLPVGESMLLLLVALLVTAVSYRLVENPLRHLRRPSASTVAVGGVAVASTFLALTLLLSWNAAVSPFGYTPTPAPDAQMVLAKVAAAPSIRALPRSIRPPLASAPADYGGFSEPQNCVAHLSETSSPICVLGDRHGKGLLVVYGDSHAVMWLQAFDAIAIRAHWRLVVLAKEDCPAEFITVTDPPGVRQPNGPYVECNAWHSWVVRWINEHHPNMLVVSQRSLYAVPAASGGPGVLASATQWESGLQAMLAAVTLPGADKAVLGNIPERPSAAPACLSGHSTDIQACSTPVTTSIPVSYNTAEASAAAASGARYLGIVPWFCSSVCTDVIKRFVVYMDQNHVSSTYAQYLEVALGRALGIPEG
jgi:peptidoglycan/LPS O-acetylase OafA/YrhL